MPFRAMHRHMEAQTAIHTHAFIYLHTKCEHIMRQDKICPARNTNRTKVSFLSRKLNHVTGRHTHRPPRSITLYCIPLQLNPKRTWSCRHQGSLEALTHHSSIPSGTFGNSCQSWRIFRRKKCLSRPRCPRIFVYMEPEVNNFTTAPPLLSPRNGN